MTKKNAAVMPVYLVTGDEPILRQEAVHALVERVLGDDDASLALEEVTLAGGRSAGTTDSDRDDDAASRVPAPGTADVVASVVLAARTSPFGTAHRVVVVREVGALTVGVAEPLIAYLKDPEPTTVLVLVSGGGTIPAALATAARAMGEEIKTSVSVDVALRDHLHAAGVVLDPGATAAVTDHVGQDAGRVPALVEVLHSVFGSESRLAVDDVAPYLTDPGTAAPWLLANAIDAGDVAGALEILDRLRTTTGTRQARPMHWLQITGLLHSHYRRLSRLDSPDIATDDDAVAALGGRTKPYAAKKALMQSRRLGTGRLRTAIDLLAQADLDLRGASGVPDDAVLEILVARLASLSRAAGAGGDSRSPARSKSPSRTTSRR